MLLTSSAAVAGAELPRLDCVVTPNRVVDVSSAVPGVLRAVYVDRSDFVEVGQVVAQLETGVEQAELALAQARAALDSEIQLGAVNLEFDRQKQARVTSLQETRSVSRQDKDDIDREAELSAWRLKQARDVRRLRALEVEKATEELKQKTVHSPIGGVVLQRFKSSGEYVKEQPILRIAQIDPLKVETIVPMEFFGRIRVGMDAEVVPEGVSGQPQRATVTLVDRMGDAASGTFGVQLQLPNPDTRLPAGLKCSLRLLPETPPAQAAALDVVRRAEGGETAPARVCRRLGPVADPALKERLSHALHARGYKVAAREEAAPVTAYIVLTSRRDTAEQARSLRDELWAKGIRDVRRFTAGEYVNRLSLGVYINGEYAEKRREQLAALGIETEVREFDKAGVRWWLDVELPGADIDEAQLREGTEAGPRTLDIQPLDCRTLPGVANGPGGGASTAG